MVRLSRNEKKIKKNKKTDLKFGDDLIHCEKVNDDIHSFKFSVHGF